MTNPSHKINCLSHLILIFPSSNVISYVCLTFVLSDFLPNNSKVGMSYSNKIPLNLIVNFIKVSSPALVLPKLIVLTF